MISESDAVGKLKTLYKRITGTEDGKVANILKVHSLHPSALDAHLKLYKTIMYGESGLSRKQRETIATLVSQANSCDYWVAHHGTSLRVETNREFVDQLLENTNELLDIKDRCMITYALKLTKTPNQVGLKDVEALYALGFSQRDVFDINQVTSYFNYVNRIASGLGVELEEELDI